MLETKNGRRNPTPKGTRQVIDDVDLQIESEHEVDDILAIVPYTLEKSFPEMSKTTLPVLGKFESRLSPPITVAAFRLDKNLAEKVCNNV